MEITIKTKENSSILEAITLDGTGLNDLDAVDVHTVIRYLSKALYEAHEIYDTKISTRSIQRVSLQELSKIKNI